MTQSAETTTVLDFLDRFAERDADGAVALVDDAIVYTNVGLPAVRGKKATARVLTALGRFAKFDVAIRSIASDGPLVLTERVDELGFGPLQIRFWVNGRFEVVDGKITVWKDYFDNVDVIKGLLRGLIALAVPRARRPLA